MPDFRFRVCAVVLAAAISGSGVLAVRAQTPAPAAAVVPAKPAGLDAATLEKKIDELVDGHKSVNGFSGAMLLASQGKPLVAKGYGYANVEWQIPNTTQTKFRIGSITKQFTSMLVMQLREQGKIKLEDSVCVYVTPCPEAWKPVTIHHLLTHTSGIPTYTGIAAWRETNMMPKTADQVIAHFRELPLQWVPGEKYQYNNSGYFLLGVVIVKASGKKYEQALQEMIFTPLGMSDSGYDWSKTIIPRRAAGYSGRGGVVTNAAALDMQQPYSAGALYSTVEDLLKWDQALYTDKLLPEAAKKLMWTPFKENYGYGWIIGQPAENLFGGYKRIAHGGGINGFSSVIVRLPEPNVTVIVLSNNDAANASQIGRDIVAIYYGKPYTIPAPVKKDAGPSRRIAITIDDLPTASVLGNAIGDAERVTKALVAALVAHKVPAIGFVNEAKLRSNGTVDPRRVALLQQWIDAGLELGNHTFSHPDLHLVPVEDFEREIVEGEKVTRELLRRAGKGPRYFRHPFLHTGRSAETRARVDDQLRKLGYRVAPVTVDNYDYIFAAAFDRHQAERQKIEAAYLDYMENVVSFYEKQSQLIVGREIPQVLLLHANALNARTFDQLARMLARRGYTFVSLDEALKDEAYASPDRYYGPAGITWLHRWAITAGLPGKTFAGEPEVPDWIAGLARGRT